MAILEEHGAIDSTDPATTEVGRPLLYDGQRLDQPTFHELYLQTPENFRAELIDGMVYVMSSPVSPKHGRPFSCMNGFLYHYYINTPGTIGQGDTTTKLGPQSEVQPDCALLIDPDFGGQTGEDSKGYTTGCPELVVEISSSTLQIDLNAKKRAYEESGAREYLVYDEPHRKFHWFILREGKFEPFLKEDDGLYRSQCFPGLWFDEIAFLADDGLAVLATLRQGLGSPEHAAFVERLRENRAKRP
jgi:Uma2 family endonuclease